MSLYPRTTAPIKNGDLTIIQPFQCEENSSQVLQEVFSPFHHFLKVKTQLTTVSKISVGVYVSRLAPKKQPEARTHRRSSERLGARVPAGSAVLGVTGGHGDMEAMSKGSWVVAGRGVCVSVIRIRLQHIAQTSLFTEGTRDRQTETEAGTRRSRNTVTANEKPARGRSRRVCERRSEL